MRRTWLALFLIGILVLSGCGKDAVEKKTGKFKYKNENSQGEAEVGENVTLPSNFPKDVPIYKGATVTSHITNKSERAEMTTVTLQTTDGLKKVGSFYEASLAQNGFEQQGRYETDQSITFNTKKGDMAVIVAINNNDGKTTVGINITSRQE